MACLRSKQRSPCPKPFLGLSSGVLYQRNHSRTPCRSGVIVSAQGQSGHGPLLQLRSIHRGRRAMQLQKVKIARGRQPRRFRQSAAHSDGARIEAVNVGHGVNIVRMRVARGDHNELPVVVKECAAATEPSLVHGLPPWCHRSNSLTQASRPV